MSDRAWHRIPEHRTEEIKSLTRRTRDALVLSALTGVMVGFLLYGVERATLWLFEVSSEQRLIVRAILPMFGLIAARGLLKYAGGNATSSTSDEYISNFHSEGERLGWRPALGRIPASVSTIGTGGAVGMEGVGIYLGAVVGSQVQARLSRWFRRVDAKLLTVAGAAAGVAAVFRTPATGALFAIEVPYHRDVVTRSVIPAMVGAASSFVVVWALERPETLLPLSENPPIDTIDILGALLVGLACGLGARGVGWLIRSSKKWAATLHPWVQLAAMGLVLAGFTFISDLIAGEPLSLGPGVETIKWADDFELGLLAIGAMLLIRTFATAATFTGGGVGGVFIPLVVAGALTGRLVGGMLGLSGREMFLAVGMAAFLGAGYRTPLAGVMFVAEISGRASYVVPALVATAVAQMVVGRSSVSSVQRSDRPDTFEERLDLTVTNAIDESIGTVPPDTPVDVFAIEYLVGHPARAVPIVTEDKTLVGIIHLDQVLSIDRRAWHEITVKQICVRDHPSVSGSQPMRDAVKMMEEKDVDLLPVLDGGLRYLAVVTTEEVVRLEEVLTQLDERRRWL